MLNPSMSSKRLYCFFILTWKQTQMKGIRRFLALLTQLRSDMKCIPDNANTGNRGARNNSSRKMWKRLAPSLCVCVCALKAVVGRQRVMSDASEREVCVCMWGGSSGGVWFCAKELIKVTFVSDAWGSEGSFGTCVCGAKLTVNTNNQSAGPIEYWRQSNRRRGPGLRDCT